MWGNGGFVQEWPKPQHRGNTLHIPAALLCVYRRNYSGTRDDGSLCILQLKNLSCRAAGSVAGYTDLKIFPLFQPRFQECKNSIEARSNHQTALQQWKDDYVAMQFSANPTSATCEALQGSALTKHHFRTKARHALVSRNN